jgi:murein L,D-transpeptidase YcbB/YkuD
LQKLPNICKISASQNAEHLRQNRCDYRVEAVARKWQLVQAVLHFLKPGNRRKKLPAFLKKISCSIILSPR